MVESSFTKIIFFGLFFLAVIAFILRVPEAITPFFVAFIFAYLLEPLISKVCRKYNIPRTYAATFVFFLFTAGIIIVLALLIPLLYKQIATLIAKIPGYKIYIQEEVVPFVILKTHSIDPEIAGRLEDSIHNFINGVFSALIAVANNIWGYTLATINIASIILLVPIILFYFLRDWNKMTQFVDDLIPLNHRETINEIINSINSLIAAYVRGQLNICILLAIYYAFGLSIIGLDLGALIGIISGFLMIIPFFGFLISFLLALISCYLTFGFAYKIFYIIALYVIGFIMEGYIFTPRIIGSKIGLHPLWIMFSVFVCASLFNFWGIFFAIPIAGITKIMLHNGISLYKSSKIYGER